MKKLTLLLLPLLLILSANASAANFFILSRSPEGEQIRIVFRICVKELCTNETVVSTDPGTIFEKEIRAPEGEVVKIRGIKGSRNGKLVEFGEHCSTKFEPGTGEQGSLILIATRTGNGLLCVGAS